MAAHFLLILTAATLWGQPPRGEIAPFGFTPDGAARYHATPASTAWVWSGEWRPVPITGMEARVSTDGVLTLVEVEALRARAAALEAQVFDLRREVELLKLAPAGPAGPASVGSCRYLEQTSDNSFTVRDCAGQESAVLISTRKPCTVTVWLDRENKIAWGGCGFGGDVRTVPTFARYLGAVVVAAPCKPPALASFGWACDGKISDVIPASRPTDVIPRWLQ